MEIRIKKSIDSYTNNKSISISNQLHIKNTKDLEYLTSINNYVLW